MRQWRQSRIPCELYIIWHMIIFVPVTFIYGNLQERRYRYVTDNLSETVETGIKAIFNTVTAPLLYGCSLGIFTNELHLPVCYGLMRVVHIYLPAGGNDVL